MFSNRCRFLKIPLVILLMAASSFYTLLRRPDFAPWFDEIQADHARYAGRAVPLNYARVTAKQGDRVTLSDGYSDMEVRGGLDLEVGEIVSALAYFDAANPIPVIREYRTSPYAERISKHVLSALPLVFLAAAFLIRYRMDFRRLTFVARERSGLQQAPGQERRDHA